MYHKIVLAICCNFAIAAVIPAEKDATILNYNYENYGKGNYQFSFVTSNGIKRNETGQLVNDGLGNEYVAVQGFYAFTDPDGKFKIYMYTADENGYDVNLVDSLFEPDDDKTISEKDKGEGDLLVGPISPQLLASLLGGG